MHIYNDVSIIYSHTYTYIYGYINVCICRYSENGLRPAPSYTYSDSLLS